eukprot:5995666-Prymnesium_polylepis.1
MRGSGPRVWVTLRVPPLAGCLSGVPWKGRRATSRVVVGDKSVKSPVVCVCQQNKIRPPARPCSAKKMQRECESNFALPLHRPFFRSQPTSWQWRATSQGLRSRTARAMPTPARGCRWHRRDRRRTLSISS